MPFNLADDRIVIMRNGYDFFVEWILSFERKEDVYRWLGVSIQTAAVHVMFRAQPKSEISKFINAYKSASSRLLKKEYPQIRGKLWKEAFWSQSFCLVTAGGAPIEVIRSYIESQGEKDEQSIQVSDLSDQGAGDSDP